MPSPGSERGVYLVGMMGAGKSIVGAQLAEKLDLRFVDLDVELEHEAKRTVAEMFALEGETAFRVREARLVRALDATRTVVATGGGVVTQPGLVEHMRVRGRVVYLRAAIDTLLGRIALDPATRPMLLQGDPRAVLERLLEQRRAQYERAHVIVDTDGLDVHAVVERVREALE